ncbi:hypothetical protein JIN84_08855 [Luteolibacter yonseiensis]|uniref:Uncharacterized protein n=1 Tax=Luteolibacter yonseiensis TaxID=1144680 RepID=A0A934VBS1_9BACT|nr:hypothetical protein [Luteolibacter yonseiensis]MBK1815724.1 hypothetical protein [Luteolibacter yonseiensis]
MKPKVPLLIGLVLAMSGLAFLYFRHDSKPVPADGASASSPVVTRDLRTEEKPADGPDSNSPIPKTTDPAPPEKAGMTPDMARKLISDFAAENKDLNSRAEFTRGVIKELCESGYSKEAWDLIDPGNGIVRNFGLASFFENADLPPADLLDKIANVPRLDMFTGFSGFLNRYPPDQLSALLDSPEVKRFYSAVGDDLKAVNVKTAVSGVLQIAMNKMAPEERGGTYQLARELDSKGLLEAHDFILIVQRYSNKNIFEQWEDIKAVDLNGWSSNVVKKQRQGMLSDMVAEDAPAAVKGILNGDEDRAGNDLAWALKSWTNLDSQGAADWYKSSQASFSGRQRELVSSSFAEAAISSLEFESARQWAEQIEDAEARRKILENVEQKRIEYEQKSVSK